MLFFCWGIPAVQAGDGWDWYLATDSAFSSGRYGHTSVVFNDGSGDAMWVMGGNDGSFNIFNDIWNSTGGITWSQAHALFAQRYGHTSVVFDNKAWVIGGYDASFTLFNDASYSTDGITWTEATSSAGFSPRYGHTSLVFNNGTGDAMWVVGGYDGLGGGAFNDVWYSTDGITWNLANNPAFSSGRYGHISLVFNNGTGDAIWVIGGDDGYTNVFNDVWYSMDGITWNLANGSAEFPGRAGHTSVVFDNKIWVVGGYNSSQSFNDAWYSTDGIIWTQATVNAGFSPRYGHTSVVYDNRMWVIGGYDNSQSFNDVWYSTIPVPLTVTSINPVTGINTGSITMNDLSGTGFDGGATVELAMAGQANITATGVNVASPTQITCTFDLTGAAIGAWDVIVTNPDGQSFTLSNGFTVVAPPPMVTGIIPATGFNTGLFPLSNLAGTGFIDGATVNLTMIGQANIPATNASVVSPTQITCDFDLTGKAGGLYTVTVTNPDGQSGTLSNGFTVVVLPPVVLNITPAAGFNNSLVDITLDGTGFMDYATVKLTMAGQQSINATNVIVFPPSQITCTFDLKGVATGTWTLIVTNPDGQASQGGNNIFQFVIQAAVSQVSSPASPPPSGGSGGVGHSSNDYLATQGKTSQPAQPPVERQPATYYGEGKIDTTAAGINRDPVIIESSDHGVSLAIDAGAEAFDSTHHPLTLATARTVTGESIPPIPTGTGISFTGIAYDIGPDGATFNPPATLSITVPGDQWNRNTRYSIQTYSTQAGSWEEIPSTVDTGLHIVSGQVSHLCLFGLFAVPAAGPATPAPTIRAPVAILQVQPESVSQTPMGIFTGMMGWIYATARAHIPVSFTIVLAALAAIYASTRRAWLARNRTWITLYLISLTGFLWALFLSTSGGPLWESAWILITVTGLNLIVHILRFDRIDLSSRARPGYVEIGYR